MKDDSNYELFSGITRIVLVVLILAYVVSIYNTPPFDEPVVETQVEVAPPIIVQEWYPDMGPDITFDEGNGKGRNWIY